MARQIVHIYKTHALSIAKLQNLTDRFNSKIGNKIISMRAEFCFNIEVEGNLSEENKRKLDWLLGETFIKNNTKPKPTYFDKDNNFVIEIGPRLSFSTAWSTNALAIFHSCLINDITNIERSTRYLFLCNSGLTPEEKQICIDGLYDPMTENVYKEPLTTFENSERAGPTKVINIFDEGSEALVKINDELGLSFDQFDINFYFDLFKNKLNRNPTEVELFDMAQSNSEHSRHWFFSGEMVIDGIRKPKSLFQMVKSTLEPVKHNSKIGYHDNSSSIEGCRIMTLLPTITDGPSVLREVEYISHPLLTAETHNFPSGVAPFPGAETGTGGRIRDVQATGKGANVIAGSAGYSVGNLCIPGYDLPWESKDFTYPETVAKPLQIIIDASNGASDYGNKFGEPVFLGFTRSYGLLLNNNERREWIKPIMFSGGIGQLRDEHLYKDKPEKGMLVVKVGGPAYRIGLGGGAASSRLQDSGNKILDLNAVQRGDAEMENKMNRAIRACIELGNDNPIISIHDQGAGGNGNVLKEIVDPSGAKIDIRQIKLGDITLSALEIWGSEYQENCALLIRPEKRQLLEDICMRENVPVMFVGEITGDGKIVVIDSKTQETIVDLDLKDILGDIPKKQYIDYHPNSNIPPLEIHEDIDFFKCLSDVLKLLHVGSKRFLTNKVDRSVTGLIRQQQCVGPLLLPISDVAVVAQSHFSSSGIASSIGEQPIKGLANPRSMARMTMGEALTNIMWAKITQLNDIKCSGNWMWASKLPGEASLMYDAVEALTKIMLELGVAIDGGKDSLSMASRVTNKDGKNEIVKSPGTLVLSLYASVPDISKIVTPYIKHPSEDGSLSHILYIDLGYNNYRLGCSSLAQVLNQVGCDVPDLENSNNLRNLFNNIQLLIDNNDILSGHDRSDGGLITCILEMAFSGNCGLNINIRSQINHINYFFAEELGACIEVATNKLHDVIYLFQKNNIPIYDIGYPTVSQDIIIKYNDNILIESDTPTLRDIWESTSFELEKLQCNPVCVNQEQVGLKFRKEPPYQLTYRPEPTLDKYLLNRTFRVACIRDEGSNGDREMISAFYMAGFEVWDVHINDIKMKKITLDSFRGVAFVGGFGYADVLDSAKGSAGVIKYNENVKNELNKFYNRNNTFSFGVCNGAQLLALLGWVPHKGIETLKQPRFIHNESGRFESRFVTVKIYDSPSIMFKDMKDSVLGVIVSHGEGQCFMPDNEIAKDIIDKHLVPVRYVDDNAESTQNYPFNPNGSHDAIAAICSTDGRHLAIMPHPERVFLNWQWQWKPESWNDHKSSPWMKIFQNAREWCELNP